MLPSSITELESYAFSDCSSLESITFPANDYLLGELILSGCHRLRRIIERSSVPPKFDCESYLFEPDEAERYAEVVLQVAPGNTTAYRHAHGWRLFRKIEE